VRPIDVHNVLLIAGPAVTRALKDQALAIVTEVGFGILSAVRELSDVAEMRFPRLRRENARLDRGLRRQRERAGGERQQDNRRFQESSNFG
jgi:prophage DNA circulation protein